MKIINLPRGSGKTTRAIYLSEWFNAPILCLSENHKKHIIDMAKQHQVNIPEPITVYNIEKCPETIYLKNIIIDESLYILEMMLNRKGFNVIGCTLSSEE